MVGQTLLLSAPLTYSQHVMNTIPKRYTHGHSQNALYFYPGPHMLDANDTIQYTGMDICKSVIKHMSSTYCKKYSDKPGAYTLKRSPQSNPSRFSLRIAKVSRRGRPSPPASLRPLCVPCGWSLSVCSTPGRCSSPQQPQQPLTTGGGQGDDRRTAVIGQT